MNSNSTTVNELFSTAASDGTLSPEAVQALAAVDAGEQIQAALGVPVEDVQASRITIFSVMPDDSGSIRMSGNSQLVRDGHNGLIEALKQSSTANDILLGTQYLNGFVLNPYSLLENAVLMDTHNYDPNEGTPLYDQTVVLLGSVIAKVQQFENNGVQARTSTLIISDGADMHSHRATPAMVKSIVDDMLATENHIVAAMGIDDGRTDFRGVFRSMGIRDEWILTPKNTDKEIRAAFRQYSQSAVRASQHAGPFSSVGGFGS